MKILVVCQHYWPEPYRLPDACEQLVLRGHEVWVITGVPNYPLGRIYPDYQNGKNREEIHNGVHIIRTFTIGRRNNLLFRFLNYYSFAISSTIRAKHMPDDFDVVFAYQTSPVMMARGALAYAKRFGKKVVLYCLDLWPASLRAGGIRKNSVIYRLFRLVSKNIYCQADMMMVSSRGFIQYICQNFGVFPDRIQYLPQYADKKYLQPYKNNPNSNFNIVFAGNVGVAQNMQTILFAAKKLGGDSHIIWHIVGEGSELNKCKAYAARNNLCQIVFHGYKSGAELEACYRMADVMLVSLIDDPVISLTLPLKMQSYMAAGKPIIASANGEIATVIEESSCGYVVPAGDFEKLAEAVIRMKNDPNFASYGENAKKYYECHFSEEQFITVLEETLKTYADNSRTIEEDDEKTDNQFSVQTG